MQIMQWFYSFENLYNKKYLKKNSKTKTTWPSIGWYDEKKPGSVTETQVLKFLRWLMHSAKDKSSINMG